MQGLSEREGMGICLFDAGVEPRLCAFDFVEHLMLKLLCCYPVLGKFAPVRCEGRAQGKEEVPSQKRRVSLDSAGIRV